MKHKFALQDRLTIPKVKSGWLFTAAILVWSVLTVGAATALAALSQNGVEAGMGAQAGGLKPVLLITVLGLSLLALGALIVYARVCRYTHRQHIRSEHRAVNYLNIAGNVIVALDVCARGTFVNQAGCRVFGYSSDEIVGRNWIEALIPVQQRGGIRAAFQRMIRGYTERFAHLGNFELLAKDGSKRLTSWHNVPIRNQHGEITGVLCCGEDITERARIEEELREYKDRLVQLAHYDYLTKLPNRPLFQDRLKQAIAQAHRTRDQVALLLLDLDRFKNINDTLGHHVGDQYLKVMANRLRSCMREGDTVARLGGDEFVVILHKIANPRDAKVVAEKLLLDLARPVYVENNELKTTTSIGISFYPSGGATVEELLKTADAAMYQAKEHGRNNYQFYTEDMNAKAIEWLALESDLQQALDKGELVVHYQPQYDLTTGELVGMEALLRWQHPTRGLMEPRKFIPLAEETGQIMGIGNWVLHTACAQNLKWQQQGYSPVKVSVNLSDRQFHQKNLAAAVSKVLRETGLAAKYLELEFTESIVMQDAESAVFTLIELRCLGISLVIDDFGMGYSSLNHLKRFPLDKLKIDGSFVRRITSDANDAAISAATIALAHNMGMQVIAESVENEVQADFLSKQGCDEAQGHYYSQPKAAEHCGELLNKLEPGQRDRLQLTHPNT